MSTTARKLRKRENVLRRSLEGLEPVRYQHPTKISTPVHERIENQPRQIFGKGNGGEPTRYGLSGKAARRLAAHVVPSLQERIHDTVEAATEYTQTNPKPSEVSNLDPKPFRVGRKRFATQNDIVSDEYPGDVIFSPRKGFDQDRALYGTILG